MSRVRPLVIALLCGAAAVVVAWLTLALLRADPRPLSAVPSPGPAAPRALPAAASADQEARALAVVHGWDRRRSAAYAAGSARSLRRLYVTGSSAGAADVEVLRGYRSRGLRVSRLRMQVLALEVLDRSARRLRVEVTDRVAATRVRSGGALLELPRDRASTRRLTLVRGRAGPWRMATVTG